MRVTTLPRYAIVLALFLAQAMLLPLSSNNQVFAQLTTPVIRRVRTIDTDVADIRRPVGLAFTHATNSLFVVEASQAGEPDTTVTRMNPYGHTHNQVRIPETLSDSINITYDDRYGRLLLLSPAAHRLVAIHTDGQGDLDGSNLARMDITRLSLTDPQGLTLDPQSGSLFVLDRGPRIVQFTPTSTGSFDRSSPTVLDLTVLSGHTLRGIAFDPTTQHLYVLSPADQELYELTLDGQLLATRDIRDLELQSPQSITFAPTSDQTDADSRTSLFVADTNLADTSTGQIVELSLAAAPTSASANYSAALVRTTNLATLNPPSPDPSGITYLPGNNTLLISDGEVEETINGITHFQGVNMWELSLGGSIVRTSNISKVAPTSSPVTNEPTGVAFKASSGQYFIADDDGSRVLTVNAGADQLLGTADDTRTSFSTLAAGNGDPEGIAYDSWNDRLFVSDGVNMEIYQYSLSGTLVGQFDVEQYGVIDPESVEFNPDTGTLLVLSNHGNQTIVETTTSGTILRTLDVSAAGSFVPSGLAYAPASDGSGAKHFYIVDRAVDNNTNPSIIDGRLFELTAPPPISATNQQPSVNAGPDMTVVLPATGFLDATVTDDGLPRPPGALTAQWSLVSGPGNVTFATPNAIDTAATFTGPGSYVLRLSVSDGEFNAQDDLTVTVSTIISQDVRVAAGTDDAEENAATNSMIMSSTDLDLMLDSGATPPLTNLAVGLRFTGLAMPKSVRIVSAYLQFESDEVHPDATTLTIQGQAIDNAPTFASTRQNISLRARTTALVNWTPPGWTTAGVAGANQRTPDLTAVIQEIVNQPGWQSGNALALILTGSGQQVARSYEGRAAGAPMLHVEYQSNSVVNTPPIVSITAPQTNSTYNQGNLVSLSGRATDTQDGNLSARLTWRSSRDGLLGTGATITAANLSVGSHMITAAVIDSGGLSHSAMIAITVFANTNVLITAGDIAECTSAGDEATASLLDQLPGAVLALGDNAYPDGTPTEFAQCYDPSWGRHKARIMPAPGNHDYHTLNASGYYAYFGAAAGDPTRGYYSFSQSGWHIIMLNSEIDAKAGSAQEQWLRADLAANNVPCTLAVIHRPRFSSGALHGSSSAVTALWQALYQYGADIVLSGHEHLYERFGLQNPSGNADSQYGIREFVVGTGGASQNSYSFTDPPLANSELRNGDTWGVLRLTLNPTSYAWEFLPVAGKTFTDRGSGNCVTPVGLPTATATSTPLPIATNTPLPTSTPVPIATNTPLPTATGTPLATSTPTPTSAPLADTIFADDFEAGNLAAWSSVTNSTKLSVASAAALAGSYGLQVLVDDNTGRYLTDNTPSAETRYRVRFRFDPNSITMVKDDTHYIITGLNASGTVVVRAELRRGTNGYQIQAGVADDAAVFTTTGYFAISDAPHTIELDWRAATAVGANNGGVTLWIDGVQRSTITTTDNDTRRVESMRLGAVSGIDTGTRGSYYFDNIVSRRTSYIGP